MKPARRGAGPALTAAGARAQEFRRILRRLSSEGACLVQEAEGFALHCGKRDRRAPAMRICRMTGAELIAEALVTATSGGSRTFEISAEGLAFLKRAEAPAAPFEAQHRCAGERYISEGAGQGARHVVNLAESPLAWLASRKGADGAPFLSGAQLEAGERLRDDFTRAGLMARVTVDWGAPMSGRGGAAQG